MGVTSGLYTCTMSGKTFTFAIFLMSSCIYKYIRYRVRCSDCPRTDLQTVEDQRLDPTTSAVKRRQRNRIRVDVAGVSCAVRSADGRVSSLDSLRGSTCLELCTPCTLCITRQTRATPGYRLTGMDSPRADCIADFPFDWA